MTRLRALRVLLSISIVVVAATAFAQADLAAQRDELQTAIVKRDAARVAAFIRSGLDVNFNFDDLLPRQRTYESPLTMAINRNHVEIARVLLEGGASVARLDGSGRAAIHRVRSAEAVRLLMQFGADPNAPDANGRTVVLEAIERGDLPAVDMLRANGARLDIAVKGSDLFTRVIEMRHPEMIGPLLDRGVDPRSPPTRALWLLIENGDVDTAKLLIQRGADANARKDRESLLTRALFRQRWEIVDALIDAGARIEAADEVSVARFASFNPRVLGKLVAKGLDVNAVGADGHTPLTSLIAEQPMAIRAVQRAPIGVAPQLGGGAAIGGGVAVGGGAAIARAPIPTIVREIPAPDNVARAKALLDAGADPNKKFQNLTPLMLAVGMHGKPGEFADMLIAAGGRIEFDATVTSVDSMPPMLHVSGRAGAPAVMGGPSFEVANDQGVLAGMTVGSLTWAVMYGRPDIAIRLLQRDMAMDRADRFFLYFAASANHWDAVVAAVPYAKDVDAADRANVTPLMLAASVGRADVVRALLGAGAKVNARSALVWPPLLERKLEAPNLSGHGRSAPRLVGGYTALRAAKERGHGDVAKIVIQAGGHE